MKTSFLGLIVLTPPEPCNALGPNRVANQPKIGLNKTMLLSPKNQLLISLFLGILIILTSLVVFRLLPAASTKKTVAASPTIPKPYLILNNATLNLEIADTPQKQKLGLSGHSPLAENQAMLFPYSPPTQVVFWMKDMTFAIDIIYIANGKIVQIYPNVPFPPRDTAPEQLERYPSNQPIDYVLETTAGWSQRHKINVGDTVNFFL